MEIAYNSAYVQIETFNFRVSGGKVYRVWDVRVAAYCSARINVRAGVNCLYHGITYHRTVAPEHEATGNVLARKRQPHLNATPVVTARTARDVGQCH